MNAKRHFGGWIVLMALSSAGCTGVNTFTTSARPGETVAVAAGWNQKLTRNDLTVVITPASGPMVTYAAGDPRIRSLFQMYPDPVSKLVVSDRAKIPYPNSGLLNSYGNYNVLGAEFGSVFIRPMAGGQNDWSTALVLLDLPATLAPGSATVQLKDGNENVLATPAQIEILPLSGGEPDQFILGGGTGMPGLIRAIERAPHYAIRLSGPAGVIPHAVQVEFSRGLASTGNAWVTQGRGDIMNLTWADTGTLIRVLRSPADGQSPTLLDDFNFYVTGAVTSLAPSLVKAYDVAGNLLPGFTVNLEYVNN
jgi:hypothetical protein